MLDAILLVDLRTGVGAEISDGTPKGVARFRNEVSWSSSELLDSMEDTDERLRWVDLVVALDFCAEE